MTNSPQSHNSPESEVKFAHLMVSPEQHDETIKQFLIECGIVLSRRALVRQDEFGDYVINDYVPHDFAAAGFEIAHYMFGGWGLLNVRYVIRDKRNE